MVDEPSGTNVYGGNVAAPYIANLMANVLPYLGYQPTYAPEDQVPKNVGNYVGTSIAKATAAIEKLGLQWKVIGEGTQITSQFPERGTQLLENLGTVYLYTEGASEETVIVPRVVGLTPQNANQALINHGLNIKIEGAENYETGDSVLTVEQSIPEGTPVPRGTVVTVTFRHTDITD